MTGTKIYKPLDTKEKCNEYSDLSRWCNENHATINDKGEYYEVVAIPGPTLEELKEQKINKYKFFRDAEEVAPIEYDGHLFDFDDKARDRINAAIIALQVNSEGTAIEWTLADNTNTLVTYRDLMGVVANVASRSDKLHIKYRELKEKILAATTKEELDNIQWEE